jgi:hypothetical protein
VLGALDRLVVGHAVDHVARGESVVDPAIGPDIVVLEGCLPASRAYEARREMTEHQGARPIPWLIALATGFVVALAALLAPAGAPDVGLPARVVLGLPTPLIAVVMLVLVTVEFVMLGFVLFSGRRWRKRKEDDEFELYYEHPPVSPWLGALLLQWTLLLVVAMVYLVRHGVPLLVEWPSGRTAPPPGAESPPPVVTPGAERPFVSMPILTWAIAAIATLVAAGGVGFLLWLFLGHRLGRSRGSATGPCRFWPRLSMRASTTFAASVTRAPRS